jgi:ribosomal protein L11 methylase PrmA
MINQAQQSSASFRDPRGHIYLSPDRVFRTISFLAADDFNFVRGTGLIKKLIVEKKLLSETQIDIDIKDCRGDRQSPVEIFKKNQQGRAPLAPTIEPPYKILEHPRLPFISYPYEWTFSTLKAAALLQLDIHLQALECGVTLSDASAYNIQYQNGQPIFIDHLSFRRYQDGELWQGYRQFCEQFLNPLLLQAYRGVAYNSWYRGALEGITATELNQVLPLYRKFLPKVFMHVVLQSSLQKVPTQQAAPTVKKIHLSLPALQKLLHSLKKWIEKLQIKTKTTWQDYSLECAPAPKKIALVAEFIKTTQPQLLFDLGCNTGFYSRFALQNGAQQVIGFDTDNGALEQAFALAQREQINFLPLYMDLANPAPNQGWREIERCGLAQRASADALLALAITHHLAIARNIPLDQIIEWLINLAPQGLIEFVPKQDPQLQKLLCLREDIFADYSEQNFLACVTRQAQIIKKEIVSESGRLIVWYKRNE